MESNLNPKSDIAVRQNSLEYLQLLSASSSVYGKAKTILGLQFTLTILGAVVWSVLVEFKPHLKVWLVFYSFVVALLDALFLERRQIRLKKLGARIQELFDCKLFELDWRQLQLGDSPPTEVIFEESQAYIRGNPDESKIKNWYPLSVSYVPLSMATLICQRASCWWDSSLRKRFRSWVWITLSVVTVFVLSLAIGEGMTLEGFILTVLAPLAPAYLWGIREIQKQGDAAKALDTLLRYIEHVWSNALHGLLSTESLRSETLTIQDRMFEYRSKNPLVFNLVYNLFRDRQQMSMKKKADELAGQVKNRAKTKTRP